MNRHKWFSMLAMVGLLVTMFPVAGAGSVAQAQASRFFPETGHTVKGRFLTYWNTHGALAQQGYPISEEMQEQSDTDGKVYTMQYFQRAVFEYHPEVADPNFQVLLSLLGVFYYNEKYGGNAPNQQTSTTNPRKFTETGKTIGGAFRKYWEGHGQLAQQGYPISDEFQEVSQTDGKTYTVQYFQRAVFEYHPEFAGTASEVLLSLLGVFYYDKKHGGTPLATVVVPPTVSPPPTPTATPKPVEPALRVLFVKDSGDGQPALIDQQGSVFYQKPFQLGGPYRGAGWTHLAASSAGDGHLIFYKLSGGAQTGKIDSDGSYHPLFNYGFRAGHTLVSSAGNGAILLFDRATKILDPGRIEADGGYQPLTTKTLGRPWQHVVGVGADRVYLYLDEPPDQFTHKEIGRLDAQGNFTSMWGITERPRANEPRGGWYITPINDFYVFRYNTTSGQYYIEEIANDGTVTPSPVKTMEAGWTNFAFMIPGRVLGAKAVFFAYRPDTGAAVVRTFAASFNLSNFTLSDLKSYQGPTALPQGWTMVNSIR